MMLLPFVSVSAVVGGLIAYATWQHRKYQAWRRQIDTSNVLFYTTDWEIFQFMVQAPALVVAQWQKGLLVISHKRIAVYQHPQPEALFTIQPHELRGFWRPEKYNPGINEIWIHAQIGLTWHILQLRLHRSSMQDAVRSLKAIASAEQVQAYRRARPYIHRQPLTAFPAQQNLQGAWELAAPVNLYIMPLLLIILHGTEVHATLEFQCHAK
jgi:hypothetical protein